MSPSSSDIRTLVDDFATQLEQITRRMALEQVMEALSGQAGARASTGKRRGRPPGSKNKARAGKGGKRSSASMDEMQATLLAHVKANPGQRGEQIAEALKTDVGTMRLPMKKGSPPRFVGYGRGGSRTIPEQHRKIMELMAT